MGPGKVTIDITAKPRRTAVIAGSGLLPELLAGALHNPFVIGLSDDCGSLCRRQCHDESFSFDSLAGETLLALA